MPRLSSQLITRKIKYVGCALLNPAKGSRVQAARVLPGFLVASHFTVVAAFVEPLFRDNCIVLRFCFKDFPKINGALSAEYLL